MRRFLSLGALALAGTVPVGVALAEQPGPQAGAVDWLLKVSEAARHANYRGVVVYRDEERMETMRIVHRHKDGREQERLTSLNGPTRDVFREDDHVTCIHSDERIHTSSSPALKPKRLFPEMSRETLAKVAELYDFRDLGAARVAGRECRGIAIVPRDEYRYGYRVWADVDTSVPLKVSLTAGREVVEEMMFTRVSFPTSIPDAALAIPEGHRTDLRLDAPAAEVPAASEPSWSAARLPPGFQITMRSIKPSPDGQGVVEHVLLSDGLSAVSVFSSRMKVPRHVFRGMSHMGGVNVYGRMLGAMHFTVVGEVPASTVRLIGDAINP